jgi:pantoate--beta-alanine ligase
MKIFSLKTDLQNYVNTLRSENNTIGFVPTMGCLHKGHLALIEKAASENNIVICSIFVNPIQFNNKNDFQKYPRTLDDDIAKLNALGCDILFVPSEKEIYPEIANEKFDLKGLDKVMEGKFRQGHFNGVVTVVNRLFNIVGACNAYFGEKDYQQLTIIKYITDKLKLNVNICSCKTVRETDGLAMSSRNILLNSEQRKVASLIYNSLIFVKENIKKFSASELKEIITQKINSNPLFRIEYVEIAHKDSLVAVDDKISNPELFRCFIAAYLGNVRLIDNMALTD